MRQEKSAVFLLVHLLSLAVLLLASFSADRICQAYCIFFVRTFQESPVEIYRFFKRFFRSGTPDFS
jgi:hypothetical protein